MMRRAKLVNAAKWALIESILGSLLSFLSLLVVARFLSPSDFGIAAAVLIVSTLVQTLTTQGLSDALVRHETAHTSLTAAAFWLSLAMGTAGWAICSGIAPALSAALRDPRAMEMLIVYSSTCIFSALIVVPTAKLTRKFRIRTLTILNFVQKVITTAATIILAVLQYGAWSIILGGVIGSSLAAALFVFSSPQRKLFGSRTSEAFPLLAMSWQLGLENVLWAVHVRVFALLFGIFHGPTELGYLNFALRLVDEVANLLNRTVSRIALAGFASAKRMSADVQDIFLSGSFMVAFLAYPVLLGIATVCPDLLTVVFGAKWSMAAPYVEVCAFVWCFTIVRVLAPPALRAEGIQRPLLVVAFFAALLNVMTVYLTSLLPPSISIWSFATRLLITFPASFYLVGRYLNIPISKQFHSLLAPATASIVMVIITKTAAWYASHVSHEVRLAICVSLGVCIYALIFSLIGRKRLLYAIKASRKPQQTRTLT